jgi:hypothetical protein
MGAGIPASTMAVYASNWGIILGALMMAKWRVQIVRPQDWQKALGLGITGRQKANVKGLLPAAAQAEKSRVRLLNSQLKRDWKNKLKARAQQLFPSVTVTLGNADALLIAEFGKTSLRSGGLPDQNESAGSAIVERRCWRHGGKSMWAALAVPDGVYYCPGCKVRWGKSFTPNAQAEARHRMPLPLAPGSAQKVDK